MNEASRQNRLAWEFNAYDFGRLRSVSLRNWQKRSRKIRGRISENMLHYFHDIDAFMKKMHALLSVGGK